MPTEERNIVLVGFMGAGKSEVGRLVAKRTGRVFLDTDELACEGDTTISDIFASEGEAGFRKREREAVARAARERGAVIATGGGAVLDPRNARTLQRSGVLIYLKAGAASLERRLRTTDARPLLDSAGDGRRSR
ncbi:MAG: shikimate kinase, partial [Candidatus Binatia bacterium]